MFRLTRSRFIILFAALHISLFIATKSQTTDPNNCHPTQIHLSLGDRYYSVSQDPAVQSDIQINNNQAYLVWHALDDTCRYTITITDPETNQNVITTTEKDILPFDHDFSVFPDPQDRDSTGVYHTVAYTAFFDGLEYGKAYDYVITDHLFDSSEGPFRFILPSPYLSQTSRKILVAGDLDGSENGTQTIDVFQELSQNNSEEYGGWIMMGDAAYDVQSDNGLRGDEYFQLAQSFSSKWPQVMALGNHDYYAGWSFINLRIRNPLYNKTKNHYFSYNYEGIHFTSVNIDYYDTLTTEAKKEVYDWIDQDLSKAYANREQFPWIIFVAHQPIYCSFIEQGDNVFKVPADRWCYSLYGKNKAWDELLHKYSVDLMLTAHKHSYERMGPIYQNKSAPFTSIGEDPLSHTIIDAKATVFIMEGSGGNGYYTPNPYDASGVALVADVRPSYGVFYVQNNTDNLTLVYEHYVSATGEKIDYMNLIKMKSKAATNPTEDEGISAWTIIISILIIVVIAGLIFVYWKRRQQAQLEMLQDYSKSIPLIELKR